MLGRRAARWPACFGAAAVAPTPVCQCQRDRVWDIEVCVAMSLMEAPSNGTGLPDAQAAW